MGENQKDVQSSVDGSRSNLNGYRDEHRDRIFKQPRGRNHVLTRSPRPATFATACRHRAGLGHRAGRIVVRGLAILLAVACIFVSGTKRAFGQLSVTASSGPWAAFLPEYSAGYVTDGPSQVNSEPQWTADLSGLGGFAKVSGFYDFAGSHTLLEVSGTVAGIESINRRSTVEEPTGGPDLWSSSLDGTQFFGPVDGGWLSQRVDTDVFYHDIYVGLRDRLELTGIDGEAFIGCGFSHMRFDQEFLYSATDSSSQRVEYAETLETNFIGGQIVATLQRFWRGRLLLWDGGIGVYDMDVQYSGSSEARVGGNLVHADALTREMSKTAVTLDLGVRTEFEWSGILTRPLISLRYFSAMPGVVHADLTRPTRLTTDDALVLQAGLEFQF